MSSAPATATADPPSGPVQTVSLYERWKKIHPLWVSGGWQRSRRIVLVVLLLVFYASPWLRWDGDPGVRFDLTHRRFTLFWTTFVPEDFVLLAWLLLLAALDALHRHGRGGSGLLWLGLSADGLVPRLLHDRALRRGRPQRAPAPRSGRLDGGADRAQGRRSSRSGWPSRSRSRSPSSAISRRSDALLPRILRLDLTKWEKVVIGLPAAGSFSAVGRAARAGLLPHVSLRALPERDVRPRHLIISYDEKRAEPRGSRRRDADYRAEGLGACIDCRKCVHVCPTGIDIRDGLQYQCIGCAACIDACTDVMATMGYGKSLVRYTSENPRGRQAGPRALRPRLVGYASLIVVMVGAFMYVLDAPAARRPHRRPRSQSPLPREVGRRGRERLHPADLESRRREPATIGSPSRASCRWPTGPRGRRGGGREPAPVPVRLCSTEECGARGDERGPRSEELRARTTRRDRDRRGESLLPADEEHSMTVISNADSMRGNESSRCGGAGRRRRGSSSSGPSSSRVLMAVSILASLATVVSPIVTPTSTCASANAMGAS